jgi:hypothetical protein
VSHTMENPLNPVAQPKKAESYPITVKCIVDCLSDNIPELPAFREYAHSLNIQFVTREYNSRRYSEDRDLITRLPAFHIYVKRQYRNTFYPNTRPYQIMHDTVEQYKNNKQKRSWKDLYVDVKKYLSTVFHRKTAMERYQEERPTRVRSWS